MGTIPQARVSTSRDLAQLHREGKLQSASAVIQGWDLKPGWDAESGAIPALFQRLLGGLGEISGSCSGSGSGSSGAAQLTLALALVAEAQRRRQPAAWITERASCFFPPDASLCGVDLERLAVVRLFAEAQLPRAAESLLRSGGFGLVMVDLARSGLSGRPGTSLPIATQSRLAGLAKRHRAAAICLTEKGPEAVSLGSLVSLRLDARFFRGTACGEDAASGSYPGKRESFSLAVRVIKDKKSSGRSSSPEASLRVACRAPDGLR